MIVTCAQCQARFKLADEKLKAGGTKVRCSKCQTIFTVFPPEQETDASLAAAASEAPPAPEPVGQEAAPEPSTPETTPVERAFDFGSEPAGMTAVSEEESFFFAKPGNEEPVETTPAAPPADEPAVDTTAGTSTDAGGFDFETAFVEDTASTPEMSRQEAGMVEFDFGAEEDLPITPGSESAAEPVGEFDFSEPPAEADAPGEFSFDAATSAEGPAEFDFAAEAEGFAASGPDAGEGEPADFGEVSFATEDDESFAFDEQQPGEPSPFGADEDRWGEPESSGLDSFDFEEPTFESQASTETKPKESGLGFGEIDFSDDDAGEESLPAFDNVPDFAPAPPPSETAAPPPPATASAPPVQRQTTSRPRSEEPSPLLAPRRSPVSKMVIGLIGLLIVLCGAGGYLYVSGDGQRLLGQLVMKIKGESPAVPGEQLIGLKDITSSYVNNREAGQLLVIHGSAVNNFASARSAIAVKGLLLDSAGKVLQQQQVFCGNPLSEEKLHTLTFAGIEEAMHNQFGDSLSNMNVKAGTAVKFTIVFRNVPKEMANINVEVVDSKPGSL